MVDSSLSNQELKKLIDLRHQLHQDPEVSECEVNTALVVLTFLKETCSKLSFISNVGGTGLLAILDSEREGPSVVLRAELDALPIPEFAEHDHVSVNPGVGHLCGHDGHMVMLCGAAMKLVKDPPKSGKVIFLFQPAEENGKGSEAMLADPRLNSLDIDAIFALHNIPGEEMGAVIVRDNAICMASCGLIFTFEGKTSHASQPENGISPACIIADLINTSDALTKSNQDIVATVIGFKCGDLTFGISPGYGELYLTIRSSSTKLLEETILEIISTTESRAISQGLKTSIKRIEPFLETFNTPELVTLVQEAALELKLPVHNRKEPFRWSEDFGNFTIKWPGAFIGLGSGVSQPSLHNPDFDFPDELLETGISLLEMITRKKLAANGNI